MPIGFKIMRIFRLTLKINNLLALSAFAEDHGRKPVDVMPEADPPLAEMPRVDPRESASWRRRRVLRRISLAEEKEDTTAVRPWSFIFCAARSRDIREGQG